MKCGSFGPPKISEGARQIHTGALECGGRLGVVVGPVAAPDVPGELAELQGIASGGYALKEALRLLLGGVDLIAGHD